MNAIDSFIQKIVENLLQPVVALIGVLAFLYFVFGVVTFIRNADNEEKRAEGQRHMVWALVGMVILFGANAIIELIASSLGVSVPQ